MDEQTVIRELLASLKKKQVAVAEMARKGKITYAEAGKRAAEMGKATGEVVFTHLSKLYPEGSVGRDEALRVIEPALKSAHEYSVSLAEAAQEEVNKEAGVGLKPLVPEYNKNSAIELAELLAEKENFLEHENPFVLQAERDVRQVIDGAVRLNAEAQDRAGLEAYVTRIYDDVGLHDGKDPCQWCLDRAGQWTVSEALEAGVFARHPGCECTIVYTPKKGTTTVRVGGSGWQDVDVAKIEARKRYGR